MAAVETILFFDGGSRGNPGPAASGFVHVQRTDRLAVVTHAGSIYHGRQAMTNNVAEFLGLLAGLSALRSTTTLTIIGDCRILIDMLNNGTTPRNSTCNKRNAC
ncbi:TPA: hypothetical protein N0F65_011744 [Lagenidium giganteum]|uniref:RNase H type-1 domain-containing protein n=1 Tax=Lagenidium giganteum TaxID=4803 RepID=A0AAV2YIT5_9STRA|nr:TPA: hypothetical protein N0F65_011744 [Lagenidium giganteum]